MSDLPSRAAARSENRFLMFATGLMRSGFHAMALGVHAHAAGLGDAGCEGGDGDQGHHDGRGRKHVDGQAARGDQRR